MKKIVVSISLLTFLSFSLWLSLSLSAAKNKNDGNELGVVYKDNFKNWRDNLTDPGFNTYVKKKGKQLIISTKQAEYGKAMSQFDPITFKITERTDFVVKVSRVKQDTKASLRIMKAYEPFETIEFFKLEGEGGEFKSNLQELTGWEGETDMWLEIWLEGKHSKIIIDNIYFWDEEVYKKQQKKQAMAAFTKKKFKAIPKGNIFYEDFRKGLNGWRTEESDNGFGSELNFTKRYPRLKIVPGKKYGKFMSPAQPIKAIITRNTQLEIATGDMGTSNMKIELMVAHAPYNAFTIIPDIKKPGIYVMNISEKTEWKGNKEFWVQIWLGSEESPENEKGAEIKHIRIFDEKNSAKN
ncbi:hypothetical protein KAR34_06960 [bacterium]|nr:hypothetical protein [bacterium]